MLRLLRIGGGGAKTDMLLPSKPLTFNMERAQGYKNKYYDFTFKITHTNAAVITTDIYAFLKNFLLNMKFVTGASDNMFDLSSTEMAIIHLKEQSRLRYSIETATGADKVSTITLRWSFELTKDFHHPLDTVFHSDSTNYNNVQVKIQPQKLFDSVTDCTVSSIEVSIKEVFKLNPRSQIVNDQIVPPMNKVIKVRDFGFNSNISGQIIELPVDTTILGMYIFAIDADGAIKADAITNVVLRNGTKTFFDASFTEINEDNRDDLAVWNNANFNNIAYFDIAQGQMSESISTKTLEHKNTVLSLDLVAAATTTLKVMYVTVEDA